MRNGLNAATGEYEDLVKAGVIDAAKVTRSALQNAASIAALFLTTEAVVADKPEEEGAGGMPRRHARHGRHGRLLVQLRNSGFDGAPFGAPRSRRDQPVPDPAEAIVPSPSPSSERSRSVRAVAARFVGGAQSVVHRRGLGRRRRRHRGRAGARGGVDERRRRGAHDDDRSR